MKNANSTYNTTYNTTNLKDTFATAAVIITIFLATAGSAIASFDHRAVGALETQTMDTIVISAPRMETATLETIVVSAKR